MIHHGISLTYKMIASCTQHANKQCIQVKQPMLYKALQKQKNVRSSIPDNVQVHHHLCFSKSTYPTQISTSGQQS